MTAQDHSVSEYHGLRLAWRPELSGGGRGFGQDYIPLVGHLFGRVGRLFEFCAGPGYIGFSLLANGLCDHLVLSDVNPRAVEVMRETVRLNELESQVTVYESDGLDSIPAEERWDLVVANPPHFPTPLKKRPSLLTDDPGWGLHRRFYEQVGRHLAPGGSVLMQENSEGSTPEDFLPMVAGGDLSHVRTLWYTGGRAGPTIYYLWAQKGLPGLVMADEASAATLPLRDVPAAVTLPNGRPCAVRLANETGRTVRPRLMRDSGADALWQPLAELAPGAELQLPLMALGTGDYEVRDSERDVAVARLLVR